MNSLLTSNTIKRLLLTFVSPTSFYSNPIRCFLEYLKNSELFQLTDFPANLYIASEALANNYHPLTLSFQLGDSEQYLVEIAIIPTCDDSAMLVLDFGTVDIAKNLVHKLLSNSSIVWLIDIMITGARITGADCAFVTLETQPSEPKRAEVKNGMLHVDKLPIILWTTAFLSEEIFEIAALTHETKQQPDGSWLITPSNQTSSLLKIISPLLEATSEELVNNPEVAQTTFVNIFTELKEFLSESNSKNSTQVEAARIRLNSLQEILQAQGINISDDIEELSNNIQEVLSSSNIEGYLQEIVTQLQDLTGEINQSPDLVWQKIDETIESLSKDLLIDEDKHQEEEKIQEYRTSAQDAIAASFKSRGLRSFAGGDLKSES
jgi:hypothetical protein